MPGSTPVPVRPSGRVPTELSNFGGRRRLAPAISLIAAGLLTLALAAAVAALAASRSARGTTPMAASAPSSAGPTGLTLLGPADVSVVSQVYGPHQTSGWHAHAGIHAVAVLSGTLTVYDERCQALPVRAGSPYVGGQELHLTRNQSEEPVEMVVTYLSPAVPTDSHLRRGAPACATSMPNE